MVERSGESDAGAFAKSVIYPRRFRHPSRSSVTSILPIGVPHPPFNERLHPDPINYAAFMHPFKTLSSILLFLAPPSRKCVLLARRPDSFIFFFTPAPTHLSVHIYFVSFHLFPSAVWRAYNFFLPYFATTPTAT